MKLNSRNRWSIEKNVFSPSSNKHSVVLHFQQIQNLIVPRIRHSLFSKSCNRVNICQKFCFSEYIQTDKALQNCACFQYCLFSQLDNFIIKEIPSPVRIKIAHQSCHSWRKISIKISRNKIFIKKRVLAINLFLVLE